MRQLGPAILGCAVALAVSGASVPARAESRRVTVTVTSDDVAVPPGVAAALAASLAPSGVEVIEGTVGADARILLRGDGDGVRIVIDDAVTRKTTSRTVSLATVPEDARGLTVAAAADGLLRATWLEAVVAHAPPSPAAVERVATEALRPSGERPRVGLRASVERATGGALMVGGDGIVRAPLLGRGLVSVHGGARTILAVATPNGRIGGHAFTAGVSAQWLVTPRGGALGVFVGPMASVSSVTFAGVARAPLRASSGSGLASVVGVGATAFWRVASRWRVELEPSVGVVVRAVRGTDLGVVETGVDGALLGLSLGIAAEP